MQFNLAAHDAWRVNVILHETPSPETLAQFIRAQLILAALTGVVFSIVLTVMRVPYGYVMGIIAGFLEFIPIVGPLAAAVPIVGVALGMAYGHVIVLVLVSISCCLAGTAFVLARLMSSFSA